MTDNAHNLVDIAIKMATPLGVCALLLLQTQFVARQEFVDASEKLSGRVEKIEQVLVRMEASAETDRRLADVCQYLYFCTKASKLSTWKPLTRLS